MNTILILLFWLLDMDNQDNTVFILKSIFNIYLCQHFFFVTHPLITILVIKIILSNTQQLNFATQISFIGLGRIGATMYIILLSGANIMTTHYNTNYHNCYM